MNVQNKFLQQLIKATFYGLVKNNVVHVYTRFLSVEIKSLNYEYKG